MPHTRICKYRECSKEVTGRKERKFCSRECVAKAQVVLDPVECHSCKKMFKPANSKRTLCSIACRVEHRTTVRKERKCVVCGDTYKSRRKNRSEFCSWECRAEASKVVCAHPKCDTVFRPSHSKGKYCSRDCYNDHQRKIPYKLPCVRCGTEFKPDDKDSMFCSLSCHHKTRAQNARLMSLFRFVNADNKGELTCSE